MANFKKSRQVLENFGRMIVREQRDRLKNFKKNDIGKLSDSLEFRIIEDSRGISIEFISVDYGQWVDKGRYPFKGYPAMRLLSKAAAAKRRKLRLGTKPFQIFREGGDVFSKRRMEQFERDLEEAAIEDLTVDFK